MPDEPGRIRYPSVFEPLALGPVTVSNRVYMAPHGITLEAPTPGYESHNAPALEHAYYFAERAAAGVGLIFHSMQLGPFAAHAGLRASPGLAEAIPAYRRVADMVHEAGAKIMAEIWYVPWQQHRWDALGPEAPSLAPSAIQNFNTPATRHALRERDIGRIVEAHVVAVKNLREAGYDGVELHASHGSVLEYFLSPYFNHRSDRYGGSLENRVRFLREALVASRAAAGPALALGMRLTTDQLLEGGFGQEGAREVLEYLVPTGLLDFVDLDIAVEPEQDPLLSTSFFEPPLHNAARVANVAPAAHPLPVLATPGRVTTLAEAERLLREGGIDMVGIVRGLIAEPELVKNALEGNEHRSRICVAANHCAGGNLGFGCALNAAAGREPRWGRGTLTRAARPMRVVVVGGGPAGLEAARVAALRGHQVTLFERNAELGGGVALWAAIPGREQLATLPSWFAAELAELGVDVRSGGAVDEQGVLEQQPEVVVVATGARYDPRGESGFAPRPVPGWENEIVHTPEQVIRGEVTLGGRVIVLEEEGYHAAVGVAEIAAATGAEVELVTRQPVVGARLQRDSGYVVARLLRAGVRLSTSSWISEIGPDRVTLFERLQGRERVVEDVTAVVLATMRKPLDELADALEGRVRYVYLIGDALSPRGLREATYEGHRFGRAIGDPEMPESVIEELFKPLNTLIVAGHA